MVTNVSELKEYLQTLPPETPVVMQKEGEGSYTDSFTWINGRKVPLFFNPVKTSHITVTLPQSIKEA